MFAKCMERQGARGPLKQQRHGPRSLADVTGRRPDVARRCKGSPGGISFINGGYRTSGTRQWGMLLEEDPRPVVFQYRAPSTNPRLRGFASLPAGLGGNSAELRRGDRHNLLQEAGGFQRSRAQKLPKGSQRQKGPQSIPRSQSRATSLKIKGDRWMFQCEAAWCQVSSRQGLSQDFCPAWWKPQPVGKFASFFSQSVSSIRGLPLPAATALSVLEINLKLQRFSISISDRKNFHHQFEVSRPRAWSNALWPPLKVEDVRSLNALESSRPFWASKRRRYDRRVHGDLLGGGPVPHQHEGHLVQACFASIPQGVQQAAIGVF